MAVLNYIKRSEVLLEEHKIQIKLDNITLANSRLSQNQIKTQLKKIDSIVTDLLILVEKSYRTIKVGEISNSPQLLSLGLK